MTTTCRFKPHDSKLQFDMKCDCKGWAENIDKVNGPIVLQSIRSGGAYQYDGAKFQFCPWCGDCITDTLIVDKRPITDTERMDNLERYLSDPDKNIAPPFMGDNCWQFGFNAGESYHVDGDGRTLREAIDSLNLFNSPKRENR